MATRIPVGTIWRGHTRSNRNTFLRLLEASETHLLMQTTWGKRVWTSVRHVVAHFSPCDADTATPTFPIETSARPPKPRAINRSGRPIDMFAVVQDGAIVGFGESFSSAPTEAPTSPLPAATEKAEATRTVTLTGMRAEEFNAKFDTFANIVRITGGRELTPETFVWMAVDRLMAEAMGVGK